MREPPLGNVHFGHNLEARQDGVLEVLGDLLLGVEQPVDSVANHELLFQGLEVNVAAAHSVAVEDEVVDLANDRRLVLVVEEVLDPLLVVGDGDDVVTDVVAIDLVAVPGLARVGSVEEGRDLISSTEDGTNLGLEELPDLVHDVVVEGLAGRDLEGPLLVEPDRDQHRVAGLVERDQVGELLRALELAQVAFVGPERLAVDHRQETLLGDPALVPQDLVEALPGLLL